MLVYRETTTTCLCNKGTDHYPVIIFSASCYSHTLKIVKMVGKGDLCHFAEFDHGITGAIYY